jgi:hypothetical protein
MKNGVIQRSEQLYGLLLRLYPKRFKQQFGEEMQFVFSESLSNAVAQRGSNGVAALWGRTIFDLSKSLVIEYLQDKQGGAVMKSQRLMNSKFAALTGFLVVLPFMVLEGITTSGFATLGFPFALFIIMWLLAAVFMLTLMSTVRTIQVGNIAMANLAFLVLKVVLLGLIAWEWVEIVIDQMPCFLGVPNCD